MRFALALEYNGSHFCGWQRQPHCHSVQAELEAALTRVAQQDITVQCAGRTDSGVHALAQVVHFDSSAIRPLRAWTYGTNSNMCKHVAVHWASQVDDEFHARFKAVNRRYRYVILNRDCRPALLSDAVAWVKNPLNAQSMHEAAQLLLGTHDFSAFRSANCQAKHAVRDMQEIRVTRKGDRITIEVQANGFLHNMVRIICGCLVQIGKGERPVQWLHELLIGRDRTVAGMTAPAQGLYFLQPRYPDDFAIPDFQHVCNTESAIVDRR